MDVNGDLLTENAMQKPFLELKLREENAFESSDAIDLFIIKKKDPPL